MTDSEETTDERPAQHNGTDESVVRRDRFSGGPARSFLSSLAADERIFEADLQVDRAHVVMLAEQGIIADDEAGTILEAIDDVQHAGHDALPDSEDIHEAIETAVVERVGPVGGKMHTARSRNDEVATCIRYRLREDLLAAVETVIEARAELLAVASAHTETVMPGYTHLQPAQPTTVAHWVCSYESTLARDTARLLDAYERVDESPLGGAAFGGTPFDIDRERTAHLLGFDGLVENSMDAASARDFLVETASALAALSTTVSGLAEDVVIFVNKGYLDLNDDYASTSSIMPQKKNPDTLELARARAGDATAALDGLLTTLKGLPRAYNRDLQRATGHVWDAVDDVPPAVEVAVGAVATADWPAARLETAAAEDFATATGVADLLAKSGVPFRTAHEVVAEAAETRDHGEAAPDFETLDAITTEVLGDSLTAYVDREAVEAALDPAESVAMRDSRGGPAPEAVETHIDTAHDRLAADRETVAARHEAIETALEALQSEVNDYV